MLFSYLIYQNNLLKHFCKSLQINDKNFVWARSKKLKIKLLNSSKEIFNQYKILLSLHSLGLFFLYNIYLSCTTTVDIENILSKRYILRRVIIIIFLISLMVRDHAISHTCRKWNKKNPFLIRIYLSWSNHTFTKSVYRSGCQLRR